VAFYAGGYAMREERSLRKRMRYVSILLIMFVGAMATICAICSGETAAKNITVVDSAGRELQIASPVNKIVLLSADNCELALVLGCEDKIVGVEEGAHDYVEIGDRFSKAENVGNYNEPDLEKIAKLKPDVVFGYKTSITNGVADNLKSLGIPFVVCECNKIQSFEKDVELMGTILGKEGKAKEFLAFHDSVMDTITQRTKNITSDQLTTMYITGGSKRPYATYGKDVDPYFSIVGAKNIASELSGSQPTVSAEWILDQNPQVIIEWIGSTKIKTTADPLIDVQKTYQNDSVLSKTAAVTDGRVHVMGWRVFKGLRFSIGLIYWAKWCHPDLFKDVDPEEIHRQYLNKFLNVDLQNVWGH
jgi:iron complex transport system substrate-binding protein